MKIYATSDMHGNLEGLDPSSCDFCVIAGDFAKPSSIGKWQWHDQKKWIQKKFVPFVESYPDVEFVIVPGNHDFCMDVSKTNQYQDLDWRIDWPSNAHVLINSGIELSGVRFWGIPNVPIISYRWAFETDHPGLVSAFSKIPDNIDVLVTHSPPRIPAEAVDVSLQFGYEGPFGSSELANAVFEKRPAKLFCGHIHSGDHSKIRFESTDVYNVARVDENYEIRYSPTVVNI